MILLLLDKVLFSILHKEMIKLVGIFGDPIEHVASPRMHNMAFKYLGIDMVYVPFKIKTEELKIAVESIKVLNLVGVNVTVPHKEDVMKYLDEIDPFAKFIGAVNTIKNNDGKLIGYNTDANGFLSSLRDEGEFEPRGKKIIIFGAGGAARAIAFALAQKKVKDIVLTDVVNEKALKLAGDLKNALEIEINVKDNQSEEFKECIKISDLIINATPVGMSPNVDKTPLDDMDIISNRHFVYDVIYRPRKTKFLMEAEKKGAKILGGGGMLIGQAVEAFKIFTGKEGPYDIMSRALFEIE